MCWCWCIGGGTLAEQSVVRVYWRSNLWCTNQSSQPPSHQNGPSHIFWFALRYQLLAKSFLWPWLLSSQSSPLVIVLFSMYIFEKLHKTTKLSNVFVPIGNVFVWIDLDHLDNEQPPVHLFPLRSLSVKWQFLRGTGKRQINVMRRHKSSKSTPTIGAPTSSGWFKAQLFKPTWNASDVTIYQSSASKYPCLGVRWWRILKAEDRRADDSDFYPDDTFHVMMLIADSGKPSPQNGSFYTLWIALYCVQNYTHVQYGKIPLTWRCLHSRRD